MVQELKTLRTVVRRWDAALLFQALKAANSKTAYNCFKYKAYNLLIQRREIPYDRRVELVERGTCSWYV